MPVNYFCKIQPLKYYYKHAIIIVYILFPSSQSVVLQAWTFSVSPVHSWPPWSATTDFDLVFDWLPPPQSFEQVVHSGVQSLHSQSTKMKKGFYIKYFGIVLYYTLFKIKKTQIVTWTLYSRTILSLCSVSCASSSTLFCLSYFWPFSCFTPFLTLCFTCLTTSCPISPLSPFAINYISNRNLLLKMIFYYWDFNKKTIKYSLGLSFMILHLPSQISLHSLFPLSDSSAHPSLTSLQYLQTPLLVWLKSHQPLSPLTLALPSQTEEFVHWTENSWMVNYKSCLRIVAYVLLYPLYSILKIWQIYLVAL